MPNAEQEFLDGLKSNDFKVNDDSQLIEGIDKVNTGTTPGKEEDEESPRNRRERRFVKEMEKIRLEAQQERERRIAAEERYNARLDLEKKANLSDDPDEIKFYGDTPEGKFAKSFIEKKLSAVEERAEQRVLERLRQEQEQQRIEESKDSEDIDTGLSRVEEEFDVDLSGSTPESRKLRNGFIDFLQDLTTDSFPDFTKSFEIYNKLNQKQPSAMSQQRKALADRSMASSSSGSSSEGRKFRSGRDFIDYLQSINN